MNRSALFVTSLVALTAMNPAFADQNDKPHWDCNGYSLGGIEQLDIYVSADGKADIAFQMSASGDDVQDFSYEATAKPDSGDLFVTSPEKEGGYFKLKLSLTEKTASDGTKENFGHLDLVTPGHGDLGGMSWDGEVVCTKIDPASKVAI